MKKVCIISPVFDNIYRIPQTIAELDEFFKDKYNFEVLYYYSKPLPDSLPKDERFSFYKIKDGQSFDDCVTDGFEKCDANCVIVADLSNINYKDYLLKMLVQWENNSQIVFLKKDDTRNTFFKKIGGFFVDLWQKIYTFILGLAGLCKDLGGCRSFQLFSERVVAVIKEFPQKNCYLRNFECFVDYKTTYLYTTQILKTKKHNKIWTLDFILAVSSFFAFLALLLVVIFTAKLINGTNQTMYVLIGVGLMVACVAFGLLNLFRWFIYQKTNLKAKTDNKYN